MKIHATDAEFSVQHFIDQIENKANLTKTVDKTDKTRPSSSSASKAIEDIRASSGNKIAFRKVELSKISYKKSEDFSGKDLQGADYRGKDLRGAIFDNCDLTDAMFDGALLEGASFKEVTAIGASFIEAKMNDADLSEGDFRNSDFTKAKMQRTNLSKATFREADLGKADARDANFDGTEIGDGYMKGFNIEGANIENIYVFGNFRNAFEGAIMNPDDEAFLKNLLNDVYVPKCEKGNYEHEHKAKRNSDDQMSFGTRKSGDSDSFIQTDFSEETSDREYSDVGGSRQSPKAPQIRQLASVDIENTSPML